MSEDTTMYEAEFAEAKRVLDAFPLGHAQALQVRVRGGLIDGSSYMKLRGSGICTTCFYGALAVLEGITEIYKAQEFSEDLNGCTDEEISPLESLIAPVAIRTYDEHDNWEFQGGIQYGDTPATNALSAALDTWLTAYIAERVAVQA